MIRDIYGLLNLGGMSVEQRGRSGIGSLIPIPCEHTRKSGHSSDVNLGCLEVIVRPKRRFTTRWIRQHPKGLAAPATDPGRSLQVDQRIATSLPDAV